MQVQGARWMFGRANFYADPEVSRKLAAVGTVQTMGEDGAVDGSVATAAVPDAAPSEITATINWGDGTRTSGTVSGTGPTDRQLNSLFEVSGSHRYTTPERYTGTVTLTGPEGLELSASFTVAGPDE